MKIYFSILLILLTNVQSKSQIKIDGFGPIHLRKTTTKFIDSLIENGYESKKSENMIDYYVIYGKKIVEPIWDSISSPVHDLSIIPKHIVYKIGELNISDLKLENIELKFFNDTLYQCTINRFSSDFSDAMKLKYGEPKLESKTTKAKCSGLLSGTYDVEERNYTSTYRKDTNIEIYEYLSQYYNDKCEKKYYHIFYFDDLIATEKVYNLQSKQYKLIEQNNLKKKLDKLKDF